MELIVTPQGDLYITIGNISCIFTKQYTVVDNMITITGLDLYNQIRRHSQLEISLLSREANLTRLNEMPILSYDGQYIDSFYQKEACMTEKLSEKDITELKELFKC